MTDCIGPLSLYDVNVQFDVRVPMPDGAFLAGNLYLPSNADLDRSWPAILTLIPYHKDGRGGNGLLYAYHRHFASRGYAVLHLDIRGTGGSGGSLMRSMDGRERLDGFAAVEWVAAQDWCTGAVGAWGISYGGITSLAIAETRPPSLQAIVPIHAPTDNYESMIVHRGCRLMFWPDPHWGAGMVPSNLMPPLRDADDSEALELWRDRLEQDPWIFDWYGAPPSERYWVEQGIDAARIDVPTLVICGWQDAYPDSVDEYWSQLRGPKRLLYGPWKHVMPEHSRHLPTNALALVDRWWDRWLKGIDNGVDREPPVGIFVQGVDEWRSEREWPPARGVPSTLFLAAGGALSSDVPDGAWTTYTYDARAGLESVAYDACTPSVPYPQDQSADDLLSVTYTSAPLSAALEVTGTPIIRLVFATDVERSAIHLVAKLCDVYPSGRSDLVTFEVERGDHAIAMGEIDDIPYWGIEFTMRPTSYVFAAGHALRLSVSGSNFPYVWPTPFNYSLQIRSGSEGSWVRLPIVGEQEAKLPPPSFAEVGGLPIAEMQGGVDRYWTHQEISSRVVSFEGLRASTIQVESNASLSISQHFVLSVDADHPSRANTRTHTEWTLDRPAARIETRVDTITTLTEARVHAEIDLEGSPYVRKDWSRAMSEGGHGRGEQVV
ncbi:MAG: CocE/NonD family hydrolase [Thermomicrobiales bacterium]|nr:CocE/NonD family hydrolase [Thermomicrobiales bacterium]